jgi:NADPH:quinone reductase-like Zn-dependent oxidoreductase
VTAIQMTKQGGPEEVRLGELPGPEPGLGEVLLKADARWLAGAGAITGTVVLKP